MCEILSRRDFLRLSGIAALSATATACAQTGLESSPVPPQIPRPTDADLQEEPIASPQDALKRLMQGNQRFVTQRQVGPNRSAQRRSAVANSQQPFATILSCVDSRVPPEIVFDRGIGDLFVIRTAGQVVDSAVMGTLEFGSFELKIPLIMVLGHERCGAIKATIEAVEQGGEQGSDRGHKSKAEPKKHGDIEYLVKSLKPAVEKAKSWGMGDLVENAMRANISLAVQRLRKSPILSAAEESGRLKIVGARYDLDSGAVEVLFS